MRTRVNDAGDPLLNAWALAWVARQSPRDPAHLFDANIFHPEPRALTYSESLIVPALLVAPVRWAGGHPLLGYNLAMLMGMALSGVGMFVLARRLTGSVAAALVAGVAFTALPFRFAHYAHLQLQWAGWMPAALWAVDRVFETRRLRDGLLFGFFFVCQALSCLYYAVFFAAFLVPLVFVRAWPARARPIVSLARPAGALVLGALVAGLVLLPVLRSYAANRDIVGEREAVEVIGARPANYLGSAPISRLYGWTTTRFAERERELFPGVLLVCLAVAGAWPPLDRTRLAYLIALALAFDGSLGFNGVTYPLLYDAVMPFRGLRVAARMAMLVGMALAVLAAFGVHRLLRRAARRARPWIVAAACAVIVAEGAAMPLPHLVTIPAEPPPVTRWLVEQPPAVVLELPAGSGDDATYMYWSTWHWQRLVNGYSGFFPPSFGKIAGESAYFPDGLSIENLQARGIDLIVVHGSRLAPGRFDEIEHQAAAFPELQPVASFPEDGGRTRVYRLKKR